MYICIIIIAPLFDANIVWLLVSQDGGNCRYICKCPLKKYRCCTWGPTHNYGGQLSLYIPHMLCVNITRDLAYLQWSELQGEIRPICRTVLQGDRPICRTDLQGERMLICRT